MSTTICSPTRLFAAALRGAAVQLHHADDSRRPRPLPVTGWLTTCDTDRHVVGACVGPTIDVGCGPGRMTAELSALGHLALGIDIVPEAIAQTRARGAMALLRDVFDAVPSAGRWQTVLLADGNIGIGGDPGRLLRRCAALLAQGGEIVVDVRPPGHPGSIDTHHLACGDLVSETFRWAVVGADGISALASSAGLATREVRCVEGRWFARLAAA